MREAGRAWIRAHAHAFGHGFALPFRLANATVRDPILRVPYLKLTVVRSIVVLAAFAVALSTGELDKEGAHERMTGVVITTDNSSDAGPHEGFHFEMPGLHVDVGDAKDAGHVEVLGHSVPVLEKGKPKASDDEKADGEDDGVPPDLGPFTAMWASLHAKWKWLLAAVAFLSIAEGVVVFFSRRWDDNLSFHAARLAEIRPEDAEPKEPKVAFDFGWLVRKLKRRLRGYLLFAAGLPVLFPLTLVPYLGDYLFTGCAALWGYYWLGVFTAAKSAHAWIEVENAGSPAPIRLLNARIPGHRVFAPVRLYGRTWARVTREFDSVTTKFERAPAAFLGLALARALLALPGLYLLARPIIPLASGRLCAEVDPSIRRLGAPPFDHVHPPGS